MAKNVKPYREPTHAEISSRAHRIYEMAGRPEGKAMEHWLQAESELIAERKAQAETSAQPARPAARPMPDAQPRPPQTAGTPAPAARNPNWQSRQPLNQN